MFLRAVEISPDEGHSKYMLLGQIHSGQEAVEYYTKGIEILLSVLEKEKQTTVSAETFYSFRICPRANHLNILLQPAEKHVQDITIKYIE